MPISLKKEDINFLQSNQIDTLVIGLSGGVDSMVLLHAIVQLALSKKVIAVHVHHGLSKNADDWLSHCERFSQTLAVPFYSHRVSLDLDKGSLEEKARDARYKVLEEYISPKSVLLLGHHMGDQAETILFRLLRGTGGRGLAGIPHIRKLGQGLLLRPLMHLSKQALYDYAKQHHLSWVEDESNSDVRYSRNKIRNELMPQLKAIAPKIEAQLTHTANRIHTDYSILDRLAGRVVGSHINEWGGLRLTDLHEQPIEEQIYWLQYYLRTQDINATYAQLENLASSLAGEVGQQPLIQLSDKRLQRFHGCLYVLPQSVPVVTLPIEVGVTVSRAFDQVRVEGVGQFELKPRPSQVSLLMPSGQHRSLKKWLNDQQIPIWWRDHLPYLFQNGVLVAIGNLWRDPEQVDIRIDWVINNKLVFPKPSKIHIQNEHDSWTLE